MRNGRFLYAFKDAKRAAREESSYLARESGKPDEEEFDSETYASKHKRFGVIVFESDQDLPPAVIYRCYDDRWLLELVFRQYKNDLDLTKTNVQGDFSVIGSEFVNFIATVASCRIVRKARELGLLKKHSYGDLMDDLSSAWRWVDTPKEARSDDEYWVHALKYVIEEMELLGLSSPVPKPEPKKRGQPRKNPEVSKPKRPRGRPRKNPEPNEAL